MAPGYPADSWVSPQIHCNSWQLGICILSSYPDVAWAHWTLRITTALLPWWISDKEPPANEGDMGSIPGPGRFHMPWGSWAIVPQLLSLSVWELEATTEVHAMREATTREACVPQLESRPLLSATREKPGHQWRTSTAINQSIHTYIHTNKKRITTADKRCKSYLESSSWNTEVKWNRESSSHCKEYLSGWKDEWGTEGRRELTGVGLTSDLGDEELH